MSHKIHNARCWTDGGTRLATKRSAIGVVIKNGSGTVWELAQEIPFVTNNESEYRAIIAALEYAVEHKFNSFQMFTDSEICCRQINGQYSVNPPHLRKLWNRVLELAGQIRHFSIEHIPREMNEEADALVNAAFNGLTHA